MGFSDLFFYTFLTFLVCVSCHPLFDYVNKPDPNYKYERIAVYDQTEYTVHVLNMTSQRWSDNGTSDRPIWWHYVVTILPKTVKISDQAFLFIGLGNNTEAPPDADDIFVLLLGEFTVDTGAPAAMIMQVPNQPISFQDDPKQLSRIEDEIIAWTWRKIIGTETIGDHEFNLFFPMTKAVVRAMDTITDYTRKEVPIFNIDKYITGGPSKRGWATYLSAAVDNRVVGIIPMVFSLVDMVKVLHHHYRSLGGWSFAFVDYYNEDLTRLLDHPNLKVLAGTIDPNNFLSNYSNIPKLLVKGSTDEFFMVDDFRFFYDNLSGVKFPWIVGNANHYLVGHYDKLLDNVESFFLTQYYNYTWPDFSFSKGLNSTGGSVTIRTSTSPTQITAWYANTTPPHPRRDFRMFYGPGQGDVIESNVTWYQDNVLDEGNGVYSVHYNNPSAGWLSFYIEVTFPGPQADMTFRVTSEANLIPETYPVPDCSGESCKGTVV